MTSIFSQGAPSTTPLFVGRDLVARGALKALSGWQRTGQVRESANDPAPPFVLNACDVAWRWSRGGGRVAGAAALDVADRTWTPLPTPPALRGYHADPAVVWAGDRLFVWGGGRQDSTEPLDLGWTWRPQRGATNEPN